VPPFASGFSVNTPVPPAVRRLAADLAPSLAGFDRVREDPSLVVKRLGDHTPSEVPALADRLRRALAGAPTAEARVAEVGAFRDPPAGPAPVVYLAVESPGLRDLHWRLCETFEPVSGIEGEGYTPHVTLARGAGEAHPLPGRDRDPAADLAGQSVGPVTWTVTELRLYDARRGEVVDRIRLSA
jgi:2'-5' RNA ligase